MNENVKKMLCGLTVVFVVSFFTNVSYCQKIKVITKEGGRGYFMFGGSAIEIKDLNSRLEAQGYSKISDNFFSFGGGCHRIIGRVIIGGEGHRLIGKEVTSKNYKTSLEAGYGFFNLGYIVYSTEKLKVYPLVGLGGGRMTLNIVEKGTSPSFDDVLNNPRRGVELSTGSFLLNFALGADYLLRFDKDEKGEGGLIFGLRLGYIFAPSRGDWKMGEVDIFGAPDASITGPYIRLMIGCGRNW